MRKRILSTFLTVCMLLTLLPVTAMAAGEGGFTIDANGVLTGYTGPGGAVTIPDGVKSIGNNAFNGNSTLTSIIIPDSVESIGTQAFRECTGLTSITIPAKVKSIGTNTFWKCTGLQSVTLPEGLEKIEGTGAFECCSSLESITIPDSVTEIGKWTFNACTNLKSVTISKNVTIIEHRLFSGCSSLESINIPSGVTEIAGSAFENCTKLKNVYYDGSATEWKNVTGNGALKSEIMRYSKYDVTLNFGGNGTSNEVTTVNAGDKFTFPTPDPTRDGYDFLGWKATGDTYYQAGQQVDVSEDITYTAIWKEKHDITVQNDGNGTASATDASGAPITSAAEGTEITLTTTAADGYQFKQWQSDDVTVASNNTFTMPNKAVTVKAIFEPITYTISVTSGGNGTASASAATAAAGTQITLTATPNAGYQFKNWEVTPGTVTVAADNTFTMPAGNVTVKAIFEPITYSVTVQDSSNGTVTTSATSATKGTEITLTATADPGYQFKQWEVTPSTLTISSDNKFTMPAGNVTVKAIFEPITYSVTVQDSSNGTVTASAATATKGTQITLTVTPAEGYRLTGWEVTPSTLTISDNKFTMPAGNVTVKAIFGMIPETTYAITVEKEGNGTASATPNPAAEGDIVTLAATPDDGYQFKRWESDDVTVADNKFTMPAKAVTVKAIFEQITYPVTVTGGEGSGNYAEGAAVTITATVPSGKEFVSWTITPGVTFTAGSATSATATFTMPGGAVTVTANFNTPEPATYPVTVTGGTGGGSFAAGKPVTITATVPSGKEFVSWTVTPADVTFTSGSATTATATFTMPAGAVTATATFKDAVTTYPVTVTGGTGGGSFAAGKPVTITATVPSGKEFVSWTVTPDVTFTSGSKTTATATFTMPAGAVTATATFKDKPSSGGGGGGGGGSTPSTPSLPVNTTGQNNAAVTTTTTAAPTASNKGGTATATVNTAMGNEIIKQATANNTENVVIEPKITGDTSKAEVSIPASTVGELAAKTDASLTVSTPVADVTIPNGALDGLSAAGGNVAVTAEQKDGAVALTITAGGKAVESIPGGVTLTVPVAETAPGTVAVLVHEDGTREVVRKSVADGDSVTIPLDGSAKLEIVDNSKQFNDVPATSWAADAVAFASAHELFNGTGGGRFSPDLSMSRGMLAVVLHNLESNPDQAITDVFPDVNGDAWYAEGVAWAAANGIVSGYGNGQFGPNDNITREQLAVMLWRYAGSPAATSNELNFNDADKVSNYAIDALRWAVENGIINGKGNGILDPTGQATRAQVAQMLKNFMKNQ